MQQQTSTLTPPRARRADPDSSHMAAERASRFVESHAARILAALDGGEEMTAGEIGKAAGLTVVQVDRRMHELEKQQLVKRGHSRFCQVEGSFMCAWRKAV